MKLNWQTPQFPPDNVNNPYGYQEPNMEEGRTYFPAPQSNSTMVSDNVIMVQRLKDFVPASSVMKGRQSPEDLLSAEQKSELQNKGSNYKSSFR